MGMGREHAAAAVEEMAEMKCGDARRLASEYIDGDLDDAVANAVRGHMRVCSACAGYANDLAQIRDVASRLEPLDPPPSLWNGIERELAKAEIADAKRSRWWLHWRQWQWQWRGQLWPMAAVATTLVLGLVLIGPHLRAEVHEWAQSAPPASDEPASNHADEDVSNRGLVVSPAGQAHELDGQSRAVMAADREYLDTIAELHRLVAEARESWPVDAVVYFDERLAALTEQTQRQQQVLASLTSGVTGGIARRGPDRGHRSHAIPLDPRGRDVLYGLYQAKIDLLQSAIVFGPESMSNEAMRLTEFAGDAVGRPGLGLVAPAAGPMALPGTAEDGP